MNSGEEGARWCRVSAGRGRGRGREGLQHNRLFTLQNLRPASSFVFLYVPKLQRPLSKYIHLLSLTSHLTDSVCLFLTNLGLYMHSALVHRAVTFRN